MDMNQNDMGGMSSMDEGAKEGEMGQCVHIYAKPDGSYILEQGEEAIPQDGQPAGSLDEAMQMAKQMLSSDAEGSEHDDMKAAQAGYAKKAPQQMSAPNPQGLFGE